MAIAPQASEHCLQSHGPRTKSMITSLVPHQDLHHSKNHGLPECLVKAMAALCRFPQWGKRYKQPSPRTHIMVKAKDPKLASKHGKDPALSFPLSRPSRVRSAGRTLTHSAVF